MMRVGAAVLLALFLAGCANVEGPCPPGGKQMVVAELLYGRNVGGKLGVGEAAFRRYVDEELTPRFPDGLTVLEATGQWRDGDLVVKEPSKVVLVALADEPGIHAKLTDAREAYKRRFNQQSVGLLLRRACVSF